MMAPSGTLGKKTYTSVDTAAKACATNSACKGFTYLSSKKYELNTSTTAKAVKGKIAYIKRGTLLFARMFVRVSEPT